MQSIYQRGNKYQLKPNQRNIGITNGASRKKEGGKKKDSEQPSLKQDIR